MQLPQLPASTGQVADLLNVTEPRLNDLIRRGKINPVPSVVSGRRIWLAEHVRSAGASLGLGEDEVAAVTAGHVGR